MAKNDKKNAGKKPKKTPKPKKKEGDVSTQDTGDQPPTGPKPNP